MKAIKNKMMIYDINKHICIIYFISSFLYSSVLFDQCKPSKSAYGFLPLMSFFLCPSVFCFSLSLITLPLLAYYWQEIGGSFFLTSQPKLGASLQFPLLKVELPCIYILYAAQTDLMSDRETEGRSSSCNST